MSQQNGSDLRDPVLDVVDPGEGHSGFQEQGSAELRDQAVLPREQFRRCYFEPGPFNKSRLVKVNSAITPKLSKVPETFREISTLDNWLF